MISRTGIGSFPRPNTAGYDSLWHHEVSWIHGYYINYIHADSWVNISVTKPRGKTTLTQFSRLAKHHAQKPFKTFEINILAGSLCLYMLHGLYILYSRSGFNCCTETSMCRFTSRIVPKNQLKKRKIKALLVLSVDHASARQTKNFITSNLCFLSKIFWGKDL